MTELNPRLRSHHVTTPARPVFVKLAEGPALDAVDPDGRRVFVHFEDPEALRVLSDRALAAASLWEREA